MKKTNKIGIFLAYTAQQTIIEQGIGRLIGFLLSGIVQEKDTKLIIALPKWYEKNMRAFLEDQRIDISRVEFLTTSSKLLWFSKIRAYFKKLATQESSVKKNYLKAIFFKIKEPLSRLSVFVLSLSTVPLVFFSAIMLLLGILLLPIFLVILCVGLLFSVFGWFFGKIKARFFHSFNQHLVKIARRFSDVLNRLLPGGVDKQLYHHEIEQLVAKINKRKDITLWYVPAMFWPEISEIKAKKVVAAPDVVLVDFPTLFPASYGKEIYPALAKSLSSADHLICYSQYVKDKHLVDGFSLPAEKISVIKHAGINLMDYLNTENASGLTRQKALNIWREYHRRNLSTHPYLGEFDFSDVHFIFYSSQIRPHKNFHSLVKAYEILLRKRFVNIKLVVTGHFEHAPKTHEYIKQNRLQYDIISLPNVPSDVLAALNHLAVCAVNPTLFEGGFPFTFTEAYSVGTPSVMGQIPVVEDEMQDQSTELREHMLFDAYSIENMADKIQWAVANRDKLYQMQQPLYQKLTNRNWDMVAKEYLAIFKKVQN